MGEHRSCRGPAVGNRDLAQGSAPQAAQLRLDLTPPHLDRVFDYSVPEALASRIQRGIRVRVRFRGRLVNGFVVGLEPPSVALANLRPIERIISDEVVLTAEIQRLVEQVAERQAGTFADVLRSAVPPRHARAESSLASPTEIAQAETIIPDPHGWDRYTHGPALLRRLSSGDAAGVRAVFSQAPGASWADDIATVVRTVLAAGDGQVVVVLPDVTDVHRLVESLGDLAALATVLTAALGPEQRYRAFLRALRGHARIVIGTRAAVFAPVPDLRLLIVWDDEDESLVDPQAPYWHARDVAALRAHLGGAGLVVGGPARSVVSQYWVQSGWATSLTAQRSVARSAGPRVIGQPESSAQEASAVRLSHAAWSALQRGLRDGPVLVQVRRAGYLPGLACAVCRQPALCSCGGVLARSLDTAVPVCSRCAQPVPDFTCPTCPGKQQRLRAMAIGAERTAEEFGRAFPSAAIVWSQGTHPVREVTHDAAVVVCTPGAEPIAAGGYTAVVLLDAMAQLRAPTLHAEEEAARRWFTAALLARPQAPVVISAEPSLPCVQALTRWDAPWLADRQLRDLQQAGLGPDLRFAAIAGPVQALDDLMSGLNVDGRVIRVSGERVLIGVPRSRGLLLAQELRAAIRERSTRKGGSQLTVVMDPREPLGSYAS